MTMQYNDHKQNHVIVPGREDDLEKFLDQDYCGLKHKRQHCTNSHSEDALTWSCFDVLRTLSPESKIAALREIMEDAYEGKDVCRFSDAEKITIEIGKTYEGVSTGEKTEVDASIETSDKLIFIEAKLYSPLSLADPGNPDPSKRKSHDQIARKLRVGLDCSRKQNRKFYFIFLDIAPREMLYRKEGKASAGSSKKHGFPGKWKSAWWFSYYKLGHRGSLTPLRKVLDGIEVEPVETVAERMGWLTWSDLYKTVLRGLVFDHFGNNVS
jgi:hypothetical protein